MCPTAMAVLPSVVLFLLRVHVQDSLLMTTAPYPGSAVLERTLLYQVLARRF